MKCQYGMVSILNILSDCRVTHTCTPESELDYFIINYKVNSTLLKN